MKVQVQTRTFALKQNDLLASENCFPAEVARCLLLCEKASGSGIIHLSSSALMRRLINWKPRQFATRWTLCGTRRSPTVESQRKTCTAKHSGKHLQWRLSCYFCLIHFLSSCSVLSGRRQTLAFKGFLIISLNHRVFCSLFKGLYLFSVSPCSLSLWISTDPLIHLCHLTFLCVLTWIRKDLPSLLAIPRFVFPSVFLPFPLFKLQWQIEVRLNTAGCFNFIDPPSRGDESCELFLPVNKTLPQRMWEWDLNRNSSWSLRGNYRKWPHNWLLTCGKHLKIRIWKV